MDKPDLDKITWGEYKTKYLKSKKKKSTTVRQEEGYRNGYDTEKLIQIVQKKSIKKIEERNLKL